MTKAFSLVLLLLGVFCSVEAARMITIDLDLRSSGIEPLGTGYVYEGWVIVNGLPVSTGTFNPSASQTTVMQTATVADLPTKFVLSVEPVPDPNPAPSDTKPFAGMLTCTGTSCSGNADGATGTGVDLSSSSGVFFLATPTGSNQNAPYYNGIWMFTRPGTAMNIPNAPKGWQWEGWVAGPSGPVTTGVFNSSSGPDSDGAGPAMGTDPGAAGAPQYPGSDFFLPPTNLANGYTAVISLEPNPDDSAAPFFYKPLTKAIANTTDNQSFNVAQLSANIIGVTVRSVGTGAVLSVSVAVVVSCIAMVGLVL